MPKNVALVLADKVAQIPQKTSTNYEVSTAAGISLATILLTSTLSSCDSYLASLSYALTLASTGYFAYSAVNQYGFQNTQNLVMGLFSGGQKLGKAAAAKPAVEPVVEPFVAPTEEETCGEMKKGM